MIWLCPVGGGKALSNDDCVRFPATHTFLTAGLVPVIEPEVSISSPHKDQAETLLRDAITKQVQGAARRRGRDAEDHNPDPASPGPSSNPVASVMTLSLRRDSISFDDLHQRPDHEPLARFIPDAIGCEVQVSKCRQEPRSECRLAFIDVMR